MGRYKTDKIVASVLPFIGWGIHPLVGIWGTIAGVGMLHVIYTAEIEAIKKGGN